MKVLQVNCVYKAGSTGKIVYDIHSELIRQHIESIVCYGRGPKVSEKNVHKLASEFYFKFNSLRAKLSGLMYGGAWYSTHRLERMILSEKPDVVHLQCINGFCVNIYQLVDFLKIHRIKTVMTLHAEFIHTANCGHSLECNQWLTGCGQCQHLDEVGSWFMDRTAQSWKKMKKAFEGFNEGLVIASVSPWLMERAKRSPILEGKNHVVVYNGLNSEVFHYYQQEVARKSLGFNADKPIFFHATPSFDANLQNIKGGCYLIQLAESLPEIQFVVAGPHPSDLSVPANMKLLGAIRDQSLLAQYYSAADLTILTSKKETFSMVCAESLCCGTPVVGFVAGAPELISLKEYSAFVEFGDVDSLRKAALEVLQQHHDKQVISSKAIPVYSKQRMTDEYIRIYKQLVQHKV